jgi:periplasmic protein TonB
MPEGLLRGGGADIAQPGRHWLVLPLSIAAHAGAAIAIIILPLVADIELPSPHTRVQAYMRAASVPSVDIPAPKGGASSPAQPVLVHAPATLSESTESPSAAGTGEADGDRFPGIPTGVVGGIGPIDSLVTGEPPVAPTPPPPVQRRLIHVGGIISEPRKLVHVPPEYPRIAREARVEGMVILEAIINERGDIERLKVLRSVALLDGAAMEAVRQWRYTPTTLNNVPVPVLMTITVTFSLRD